MAIHMLIGSDCFPAGCVTFQPKPSSANCSLASTCRQIPHAKLPQTLENRRNFAACPLLKPLIQPHE